MYNKGMTGVVGSSDCGASVLLLSSTSSTTISSSILSRKHSGIYIVNVEKNFAAAGNYLLIVSTDRKDEYFRENENIEVFDSLNCRKRIITGMLLKY